MMKSNRSLSLIEVHVSTVLLGFVATTVKVIEASSFIIVLGRSIFELAALLVLLAFLWPMGRVTFRLSTSSDHWFLIAMGVVQALQWYTFFESVKTTSVAVALLSLFTFPLFVALLEPLVFKERFKVSSLVLAIFILVGIWLVVPGVDLSHPVSRGVAWGLVSALLVATLFLMERASVKTISSLVISIYKAVVALALLLPLVFVLKLKQPFTLIYNNAWLLALLGMVLTALPYLLITHSMKSISASQVSNIIVLEPVYGILIALVFLGEIPSWHTLVGGTLILGVAAFSTMRSQ